MFFSPVPSVQYTFSPLASKTRRVIRRGHAHPRKPLP
jgi:hypothetical protein